MESIVVSVVWRWKVRLETSLETVRVVTYKTLLANLFTNKSSYNLSRNLYIIYEVSSTTDSPLAPLGTPPQPYYKSLLAIRISLLLRISSVSYIIVRERHSWTIYTDNRLDDERSHIVIVCRHACNSLLKFKRWLSKNDLLCSFWLLEKFLLLDGSYSPAIVLMPLSVGT